MKYFSTLHIQFENCYNVLWTFQEENCNIFWYWTKSLKNVNWHNFWHCLHLEAKLSTSAIHFHFLSVFKCCMIAEISSGNSNWLIWILSLEFQFLEMNRVFNLIIFQLLYRPMSSSECKGLINDDDLVFFGNIIRFLIINVLRFFNYFRLSSNEASDQF